MADEVRIDSPARSSVAGGTSASSEGEVPLSLLFRQLADDSRALIHQEVTLAKVELQENVRSLARSAVMIGIGAGALLIGLLVFAAFLVLGLGRLLDGAYWLSSLIVGVALAVVGGASIFAGKRGLGEQSLKPAATVESLRENRDWALAEAQQVRRDLAT